MASKEAVLSRITLSMKVLFFSCSNLICDYFNFFDRNSKWTELNVKINVISSEDCDSLGDALRDLDAKGIIRNDFILMSAGVVTNVALKPLLDGHRKTMKLDKGAVMTLVHRKMPMGHRSRSSRDNQAVIIDNGTGKVLAYSHKTRDSGIEIPTVHFESNCPISISLRI